MARDDKGYCGLGKATLGEWDPLWKVCKDLHDPVFDDLKEGKITKSQLGTLKDFGLGLGDAWIKAVYTVFAAPLYFVFGGILGMTRYRQLIKKGMVKQDKDSGETH